MFNINIIEMGWLEVCNKYMLIQYPFMFFENTEMYELFTSECHFSHQDSVLLGKTQDKL